MTAPAALGVPARMVGSAAHVCRILDCFESTESPLTLTAISRTVGLQPSSVHRLLRTLVYHGYLTFEPSTRRYRLGPAVERLAAAYREPTLAGLARPVLAALRDATGESAALQVRQGDARYCLVEMPSVQPIRLALTETTSYPMSRGAAATILRAFAPDWSEQSDAGDLRTVRDAGHAITRGALFPGSVAIYVPLCARDGALIATIGVHGLAFRMADHELPGIVTLLRNASAELGTRVDARMPLR